MTKLKAVNTVGELKEYLNTLDDNTILLGSCGDSGYSDSLLVEKVFARPSNDIQDEASWYPASVHDSMIDSSIKPAVFIY